MFSSIDHLVITTADIEACLAFYEALGFSNKQTRGRYELRAADFKINVHLLHQELLPHAQHVQVGSADFCIQLSGDITLFKQRIENKGIAIEEGIVVRHGVHGVMHSIYVRDPDGNLLEFCSYY